MTTRQQMVIVGVIIVTLIGTQLVNISSQAQAQEDPKRKQVIYNAIVAWYDYHLSSSTAPPGPEVLIPLTKKILEEEEFTGHVFTTAEIEEKAWYELQERVLGVTDIPLPLK